MRDVLIGRRVLDFTQIGAGPTCGMLLADFGADVIKIEPLGGDIGRELGPPWYGDESPVFISFNRGKRAISVDLKSDRGRQLVKEMVIRSDVVIESFRPGVMARFGLDFATLSKDHPQLVYCAVSGYSQTGPSSAKAGVDGIMQAASGLMGLIGTEHSEPCKVQAPIVDVFSGYVAALGVMTRLVQLAQTNLGGPVDVSLFASAIALQTPAVTSFMGNEEEPAKLGSAAPYSAPNEAFQTSDGWIMIAAYIGDRWRILCDIIQRPELAIDPRFATSSDRVANRPELRKTLNAVLMTRSTAEWVDLLQAGDVLCSPVNGYRDLLGHPQFDHLHMRVNVGARSDASFLTVGNPVNAREMNSQPYGPVPGLGQHTVEILREFGYRDPEIEDLLTSKVVAAATAPAFAEGS